MNGGLIFLIYYQVSYFYCVSGCSFVYLLHLRELKEEAIALHMSIWGSFLAGSSISYEECCLGHWRHYYWFLSICYVYDTNAKSWVRVRGWKTREFTLVVLLFNVLVANPPHHHMCYMAYSSALQWWYWIMNNEDILLVQIRWQIMSSASNSYNNRECNIISCSCTAKYRLTQLSATLIMMWVLFVIA